jgi:hypothetical protein
MMRLYQSESNGQEQEKQINASNKSNENLYAMGQDNS